MADSKLRRSLVVYAQLFFGMALFGTGTPSAKVVSDAFPLFLGPFLRLLVASMALTPFLIMHRRRVPEISKRDWVEIAIIGGVGIVAFTIFLLTGMHRVNGVVGSVVMSLSPAAMALAAVLFMHDHLGWRKFLAIALAVTGVLVINVSGLYQAVFFDFAVPTLNEWIGLVVWGIGPLAIGTLIWFQGLRQVRPSTASGYMSAMPASALILSYVWLGDKFHPIHLVGFALVFTSIGLVTWAHLTKEKSQKDGESAAKSRSGAMPC